MDDLTIDLLALEVLLYWEERTDSTYRSKKVREATLARISARLKEGYGPADLKRCVDFALADEFYTAHGYAKDPSVIWRNADRVQSILSRCAHAAARPIPL